MHRHLDEDPNQDPSEVTGDGKDLAVGVDGDSSLLLDGELKFLELALNKDIVRVSVAVGEGEERVNDLMLAIKPIHWNENVRMEPSKRSERILVSVLSHQPSRTLGEKEDEAG